MLEIRTRVQIQSVYEDCANANLLCDEAICLKFEKGEDKGCLLKYFNQLLKIEMDPAIWRRDVSGPLVPIPYGEYKNKQCLEKVKKICKGLFKKMEERSKRRRDSE